MSQLALTFVAQADRAAGVDGADVNTACVPNTGSSCVEATSLMVRDVEGGYRCASADEVIEAARHVLRERVRRGDCLDSPQVVKTYLSLHMATLEHEVFSVVFVDVQNRLIAMREMFRGTLNQTSVYPREVIKEALALNAAAVLLCHNHPSGLATPSRADEYLTKQLKDALALVDVRVLDHFIVAGDTVLSFAERGLL